MSETFTKPDDDCDGFDLEGWITGLRLPERVAVVYGRGDLHAEWQALEQRFEDARRAREKRDGAGDERLTGQSEERRLAEQMEQIRGELIASKRSFRLRALADPAEAVKQVKAEAGKGASQTEITYRMLERQAVEPKVTWQQWRAIHQGIGDGQFAHILETANKATGDRKVDVPFSLAASAVLSTQD